VLLFVLIETLKLLHPFMPFITEEIWQALPHDGEALVIERYPEYSEGLPSPMLRRTSRALWKPSAPSARAARKMNDAAGQKAAPV
jgi:valyl-tRNA synthetase